MAVEYGGARGVQARFYEERQNPLLVNPQALLGRTARYFHFLVPVRLYHLPGVSPPLRITPVRVLIFFPQFGLYSTTVVNNITGGSDSLSVIFSWNVVI